MRQGYIELIVYYSLKQGIQITNTLQYIRYIEALIVLVKQWTYFENWTVILVCYHASSKNISTTCNSVIWFIFNLQRKNYAVKNSYV